MNMYFVGFVNTLHAISLCALAKTTTDNLTCSDNVAYDTVRNRVMTSIQNIAYNTVSNTQKPTTNTPTGHTAL